MTCVVSEGDGPVKIAWLKDGRPLKPREATTHQIDEYDLALRIQSASPIHDGNYTCVATNDAAKVSRTSPLLVHGMIQIYFQNKKYIHIHFDILTSLQVFYYKQFSNTHAHT